MNPRHTSHPARLTACAAGHNARHVRDRAHLVTTTLPHNFRDTAEALKAMDAPRPAGGSSRTHALNQLRTAAKETR